MSISHVSLLDILVSLSLIILLFPKHFISPSFYPNLFLAVYFIPSGWTIKKKEEKR